MDNDMVKSAEKLVEHLQEYVRSGLGTPRTTMLINPLLDELQRLREYLYNYPVKAG